MIVALAYSMSVGMLLAKLKAPVARRRGCATRQRGDGVSLAAWDESPLHSHFGSRDCLDEFVYGIPY
jgi:hypothetical protein